MSETVINILLGVAIVVFLILNVIFRRRREEKTPLGRVASIFVDISRNEKMIDNFGLSRGYKKLNTGGWRRNSNKIDFLPQELQVELGKVFDMAEEINGRIEAARKFKSQSYMAGIDVSRMQAPLAKTKEQLQLWLQENMQNPEYAPKKRGLFG